MAAADIPLLQSDTVMAAYAERRDTEPDDAAALLELALQVPRWRAEAQVWKGIEAIQQGNPSAAFMWFANAAHAMPTRTDLKALLARAVLGQHQPAIAERLLAAAWRRNPGDLTLRLALWQARAQHYAPEALRHALLAALPDVSAAPELQLIARLLLEQDPPARIGALAFDPETSELSGWALDLRAVDAVPHLQLQAGSFTTTVEATGVHPLLRAAGLAERHGGFRLKIGNPGPAIAVSFSDGTPLHGSPVPTFPPFSAPQTVDAVYSAEPVDVLIPVYDGYRETLDCVLSVLKHIRDNQTRQHVVVLDDACPDDALAKELWKLSMQGYIEYVRRPANLGFIRNMNRGMALHQERDVVWLNADTRVHGNWLDRLRAAAYHADNVASATPFSNNGELMSFPASRTSHAMPTPEAQATLDHLASRSQATPIDIEIGCGFCLYIKREALTKVGYLDEANLVRGYGEETDWCLRAREDGWRHVGAPNVFVAHQGGVSFRDEKALRVHQNNTLIKARYPTAEDRYNAFCQRDPIEPARHALQRGRLPQLAAWMRQQPTVDWPYLSARQLHILRKAPLNASDSTANPVLTLSYRNQGQSAVATLQADWPQLPLTIDYRLPADAGQLIADLQHLPLDRVLFHHLEACPTEVLDLPASLELPYEIAPSDDALLATGPRRDWPAFAAGAQAIHLRWKALHSRYAAALPNAKTVFTPSPLRGEGRDEAHTNAPNRCSPSPLRGEGRGEEHTNAPDRCSPSPLRGEGRGEGHTNAPDRCSPSPLRGEGRGEGQSQTANTFLIADRLTKPGIAKAWLALAREITRQALPVTLLLTTSTPWENELLATGAVQRLPEIDGLTCTESLLLAGCTTALSLDADPGASWAAPDLASARGLPLYAPDSPVACEAGAKPLSELPLLAPALSTTNPATDNARSSLV